MFGWVAKQKDLRASSSPLLCAEFLEYWKHNVRTVVQFIDDSSNKHTFVVFQVRNVVGLDISADTLKSLSQSFLGRRVHHFLPGSLHTG